MERGRFSSLFFLLLVHGRTQINRVEKKKYNSYWSDAATHNRRHKFNAYYYAKKKDRCKNVSFSEDFSFSSLSLPLILQKKPPRALLLLPVLLFWVCMSSHRKSRELQKLAKIKTTMPNVQMNFQRDKKKRVCVCVCVYRWVKLLRSTVLHVFLFLFFSSSCRAAVHNEEQYTQRPFRHCPLFFPAPYRLPFLFFFFSSSSSLVSLRSFFLFFFSNYKRKNLT